MRPELYSETEESVGDLDLSHGFIYFCLCSFPELKSLTNGSCPCMTNEDHYKYVELGWNQAQQYFRHLLSQNVVTK